MWENPLGFLEWSVHSTKGFWVECPPTWVDFWVGEWRVHSHQSGRGGGSHGLGAQPPIYWGDGAPLLLTHAPFTSTFWSLLLLLHLYELWLRRSPAQIVSPPPPHRRVGVPDGSTTSAAQLERWNRGLRQAVRVTEYGCAASLQRSSSRSWDRQVIVYIIHEIWSR